MFGETTLSYVKIGNHPIETTIYKWLFGVPGTYHSKKTPEWMPIDIAGKFPTIDKNRWCTGTCYNGCFSKNRDIPKWMVKIMENPIKMDDLGVPLFLETPKWIKWCFSIAILVFGGEYLPWHLSLASDKTSARLRKKTKKPNGNAEFRKNDHKIWHLTRTMHYYKSWNPSTLPSICIVWYPDIPHNSNLTRKWIVGRCWKKQSLHFGFQPIFKGQPCC